ncbi:MAG: cation transporter [Bacteroidales bacterium]|nr:cation transporter [Candidatus Sodaliphilus aphodohippi]
MTREGRIARITLVGSVANLVLTICKLAAGIVGRSSAMVADGVHSLSDLISDIVVLIFVRVSGKGSDKGHDYGHGKFETLASLIVCLLLVVVAVKLMINGVSSIHDYLNGVELERPGMIALVAAAVSIIVKEVLYQVTVRVGREVDSHMVIANAWHHRSDAFSSIGSLIGIGGAVFLDSRWAVLDPIAGCIISIMIVVVAVRMAAPALDELLDASLPEAEEEQIMKTIIATEGVDSAHGLKTRRSGQSVIIDAHIVDDPQMTVAASHDICTQVEKNLRALKGEESQILIHIEPADDAD